MADFYPTTRQALIDAIHAANTNNEADTIYLGGLTFTFTAPFDETQSSPDPGSQCALPDFSSEITLDGQGGTIERDAETASRFRFFRVNGSTGQTDHNVTIKNLTFRNGSSLHYGIPRKGGAIIVYGGDYTGILSFYNVDFYNNRAEDDGGAIQISDTATSTDRMELYLENCGFYGNYLTDAYAGTGAVQASFADLVTVINCRFENNMGSSSDGYGLEVADAISATNLIIHDSYFAHNGSGDEQFNTVIHMGSGDLDNGGLLIRNSTFYQNEGYAIFNRRINPDVQFCDFEGNGSAIVHWSTSSNNYAQFNATNNYWGAEDGPSGYGPGSGDIISNNVNYLPFLGVGSYPEHEGADTCFSSGNDALVGGNPISLRTGEKREQTTDLTLNTKMGTLTFTRSYRQSTQADRDFIGRGWNHNHRITLSEDTGLKKITVEQAEGTTVLYDDNADDIFEGAAGSSAVIVKDTNGYTLTMPDSSEYIFNIGGDLVSHRLRDGQTWYYHYSNNQLALVHDDPNFNGSDESNIQWALRFAYYDTTDFKDGKLWRVGILQSTSLTGSPDGPYVEFDYTELSGVGVFLTRVRDVLDYSQCYRYGFQENETDPILETYLYRHLAILTAGITDCSSTDVIELSNTTYTLDINDDITQIVQTRGDGLISQQFDFGVDVTTEHVTGYPGYATTHNFSNGVYQGSEDPEGNEQSELLTGQYNKAIQTDRNGNSSLMKWSADGERLEGIVDALGNELKMLYDPQSRVLYTQDAAGRTTLAKYEGTEREPGVQFVTNGNNLISNGLMEQPSNWTDVGTPIISEQRPPSAMPYGRYVNADTTNEGIESIAWDVVANNTYNLRARVYVISGTVKLLVPGVGALAVSSSGTGWQTLEVADTPSSGVNDVRIRLIADGGAAQFYVASVSVHEDDGSTVTALPLQGALMPDAYWTDISGSEPAVNESVNRQRYAGNAAWYVDADAADEGIESTSFELSNGETYQIFAYVRPVTGTVVMELQGVSSTLDSDSSGNSTDEWECLEITYTATATETAILQFLSGNSAAAEFFVDAVFVLDKDIILRQNEKTYNDRRQVTGKKQIDPADRVTVLRETEYCYDDDTCYSGGGTARGLLWRTTIKEQGGLNDILITNTYDDFGRLIQRQQSSQFGDCEISRTVYDARGQVVASICNYEPGTNSAPTTAAEAAALYDAVNYPDKNQVTTYAYDAPGRRIAVTTDAGTSFARVTRFVYDSLGRITRRIENYVDETAAMVAYTSPETWSWDGNQWIDGASTPVPIEHGEDLDENLITDTAYNIFGQVRLQRDVLGHAMLYGYDTLGQPVRTITNPVDDDYNNDYDGTNPDPSLASYVIDSNVADADILTTMRYDAAGNEIERVDVQGRKTLTIYDALNRPVKVIVSPKDSASIDLSPGDTGYLVTNDPRSDSYVPAQEPDRDQVFTVSYDGLGRVVRRQQIFENRDNGIEWDTTLYGYDTLGRQVRVIQHASQPDYFNQNSDDATLASYVPEANANDVDFITSTEYDVQGRARYNSDVDDNQTWQAYDGFNRVVQQVTNASLTGALDPDDPDYVGDLNDAASDLINKSDFNVSGRVVKQHRILRTNDAGTALEWLTTLYGYDSRGRVIKTIQNASDPAYPDTYPSDEDLSGYTVSGNPDEDRITETVYDARGRVKKSIDTRGNTTLYGYDSANRRVTAIVNASDSSYDYESNGDTKLVSYTGSSPDEDQDRITYTGYDLAGRVITSTDVAGRVACNAYDEMGRSILRVTNYHNPDNMGNPTYTDPHTWSWDDDSSQWLDDAASPLVISHGTASDQNLISQMVYNKGGELLSTRDVHGTVTSFTYDAMGRRRQVTQAQDTGLETKNYTCFDKSGRVRRQVMNANSSEDLDARMNNAWVFVPSGHGGKNDTNIVMETFYDRASRPVQRINPVGDVVETAFFKNGQVDTVTHKNVMVEGSLQDVIMLYRYDKRYRRTLVVQNYVDQGGIDPENWVFEGGVWKTGPSGTTIAHDPASSGNASQNIIVRAGYDKSGRMVSLRDPGGNETTYEYDQLNRRTKLSNPIGYDWLTTYEDIGQASRVTMTYPGIEEVSNVWQEYDVQQDFDRLGRLTDVTYPDADVTPDVSFSYDISGNRTAMLETDSLSTNVRETQYSYDAMNRLTQVQLDRDGNGTFDEAVQYNYDERGLRTRLVIDPDGDNLQVTYVYDEKGRLVSLTDWDAQTTIYEYDHLNRHTDTLHSNGVQSRYDYDAAGRLQHLRHRDGYDTLAAFKYEVDARGNRIKTWETLAGEVRTIVSGDNEISERGSWVTGGMFYETGEWDAALTLSVWGNQDVKLTIGTGPDNSIFDIYIDGTLYISPDGYSATQDEREIDLIIRDRQLRQYTIELRNRHEKNLASSGYKLQFKHLTLGKVQQIDYSYDALARVLSADYADGSRSYDYLYDLAGNRLQESVTIGITTTVTDWTYDAANRVNTMQVGSNPVDTFSYDANGNSLEAGGYSYQWNHANRLTQLDTGSNIYHYEYDGNHNRLAQRLGTTTTEYLLDVQPGLAQVLRESDGATTDYFVHGLHGVQALEQNNTWILMLQDGLGSVRAQADAGAQVDATLHHSPYGQPFGETGTWHGSFGYAGEQIDPTGLSYNRARYYDPNIGMFTALDPFEGVMSEPMSMNGYSYVHGNPVNLTDPSGKFAQIIAGGVVGGLLGGFIGFMFGRYQSIVTYDLTMAGHCGCQRKQALQGVSREDFVRNSQTWGAGLGAAFGAVTGAAGAATGGGAVASAIQIFGLALEMLGIGEMIYYGAQILRDYAEDFDIDNRCNVADFFFGALDLGLGIAIENFGRYFNNVPGTTPDDGRPRNPSIVGEDPRQRDASRYRDRILQESNRAEYHELFIDPPSEAARAQARRRIRSIGIDPNNLPGSQGIEIPFRLTPYEMVVLTRNFGVEFALQYELGPGINGGGGRYWLTSGELREVDVLYGNQYVHIYHTHPSGSISPSTADRRSADLQISVFGSNQRNFQLISVHEDGTYSIINYSNVYNRSREGDNG